jgi:hypothetical protein
VIPGWLGRRFNAIARARGYVELPPLDDSPPTRFAGGGDPIVAPSRLSSAASEQIAT